MSKITLNRKLEVKSSTNNLSKVRDFVKEVALYAGFDDEAINKIILAVDEATTNIIKHAYKFSPEGKIFIQAVVKGNKFIITLKDQGRHFEPEKVPEPDLKELHEKRKIGGLGMFLMKKLMDEVSYDISDDYNTVSLIKYLPNNE